jgi:diguanylate cyclase (GGDEF)-like protein
LHAPLRGAIVIDPAHMHGNTVAPVLSILQLRADSKFVRPFNGIRLDPNPKKLEFTYDAPSFVAPEKMQFRYRLFGFDQNWNSAGTRCQAFYTNLPPGRYIFQVQAANNDGVWNLAGASVSLIIATPITRTPYAYSVYAATVLLLFWCLIGLRTRQLVRNEKKLNLIVAERTAHLEAAQRELHTRATHDSLTGLFNRAAILEHLEREFSRATRDNAPLGVIIADIDHLKSVNDTYGHLAGDEVLRETADRLRNTVRESDFVGRYGGEEFLILFPGWDPETAPSRIDELLDAVRARPFCISEGNIQLTCSFGVAVFRPGDTVHRPLDVLRRADAALYAAKKSAQPCHFGSRVVCECIT